MTSCSTARLPWAAVPILQKLLTQLKADLPEDTREAIAYAFREMLNNAIEHGGKLDPTKYVDVLCVLFKRNFARSLSNCVRNCRFNA